MPFVETKPMPWAVNSLYSAKEGNKCTAAIVDTILVKGQDPKWLFTSKNGEVSKKRTCTGEAVRERFLKLLEATPPEDNPLRRCAVLRFPDSIKILSEEDFEKAIQNFPPRDSGLEALQVYMPSAGSAGTVYRNHYKVVSDKGRVQTATSSFASVPATLAHASSLTSDASQAVHAPSRAAKLNSTLDGATRTIVRYLESSHKVRVLDLEVDYMVDSDSQLWLLWCGDASVATGEAVLDLTLAGLTADRLVGRDSWLGEDVRKQSEAKERAESATAAASGKPKQSSPVKGAGGAGGKRSRLPGAVPDDVAAQQVAAAAEVAEALDGSERLELVRRGNRERLDDEDRRAFGGKAYDDELEGGGAGGASGSKGQSGKGKSADPHDRTFPNPFKSVGDFRRVGLRDPILLALDEGGELRSDSLPGSATGGGRRDGGARGGGGGRPRGGGGGDDDEEGPADPPPVDILLGPDSGAARMSYQSVARARAEARRLQEEEQLLQEQDAADGGSGEGKGAAPGVSGGAKGGRRGPLKGIHAPTAASESRRKWAAQRGDVPGGAANFYKEVSVTPKDMQVYTLLDRARRLREKQERLAADDEGRRARSDFLEPYGDHEIIEDMSAGGGGGGEHDDEWTRNSGDEYSSQGGHSQSGVGMSTERFSQTGGGSITGSYSSVVRSSKGSNKLQQQQQPEPAKWRGRLVEPSIEGTAAREEAVSGEVQKFDALDDYLRGKRDPREKGRRQQRAALARSQGAQEKLKDHARKEANKLGPILAGAPDPDADTLAAQDELYFASVLICDEDANGTDGLSAEGERARAILEKAGYYVDVESDGRKVIQLLLYQGKQYDCLLLERDCAVADGFEVTEAVRAKEKEERLARAREHADAVRSAKLGPKHVNIDPYVALPIIAFTGQVSPDDLRAYMEVGMDGCVSKPVEQDALLATVRAAAPQHNKPLPEKVSHALSGQAGGGGGGGKGHSAPRGPVASKMGLLGTLEPTGPGPHHLGSSALAAQSLSLPSSFAAADGSVSGVLQLDSDTALPYTVVDFSMTPDGRRPSTAERHAKPFFNLVVCHDFFDTLERMKIVLSPLAVRYPGLQVLLWNYPGQAFTEWRPDQLLNNDYLASCLHELLQAVGPNGTKQFDVDKPFHLLGFGNGANVATFYAAHYNNPSIRSLLSCNGFAFVDPHLAGALHDCMNVFSCAPPARPDLPVYFYSRFLFSPAYLASVSTPLALNLYTAVHNPISLEGRIQLCLGALSHVDLRPHLAEIDLPILAVQATQGALVKPVHSEVFVEHRRGGTEAAEAKTIFEALKAPNKTVVVWVKSGHEMFQESRDQVVTLVEQMTTGYHETHDVAYQSAVATDSHAAQPLVRRGHAPAALGAATSGQGGGGGPGRPPGHGNFEDAFLDNVLSHAQSATATGGGGSEWSTYAADMQARAGPPGNTIPSGAGGGGATTGGASTNGGGGGGAQGTRRRRPNATSKANEDDGTGAGLSKAVLDASRPSFERQDNVVYKAAKGSRIYPNPEEFPEVKEYMGWRLKRNRKRLQRLDQAARIIQGAFRSYLAWTIVRRLREARAAAFIQRLYRGWKGRLGFLDHMRLIWAAQVVQRGWRGFAGRKFFSLLRRMHAAAAHIQRIGRGYNGRKLAAMKKAAQRRAAMLLQGLWRKRQARRDAFIMKKKVHGARTLQRVYRGHLGRRRAQHEREKYLFSKSQAQGIEFGRQMLLEHKLHATRLQSEVQLLTQEKVGAEERVEALLEEISEFEEAVAQLEKEMHDLSRIETEAVGVLDEDGRFELREQKTRLDREFGEMLSKIGDRRERLVGLENKLATLDRARQGKEEELRSLERKLVVLLDEQQRELESIKRRQEKKGEMLLKTQDAIAGNGNALAIQGGEGGAGGHAGPSEKDKVQAAQLMQSTETLMKFGFMSMSMTYFSSLNMIRAMRNVAATDTVMAALQDNAQQAAARGGGGGGGGKHGGGDYADKLGGEPYQPSLQPGQMPGDQVLKVSAWSVDDVARWLQTLALGQYREAFVDAAVDGAFLYDLNEDDLRNTLGIEHRLHRKKIINMISKLKLSEAERNQQLQFTMAAERAAELGLPPPSMGLGDQYLQSAMAQSAGGGGGGGGGGNAQLALGGGGEPVAAGPPLKFEEVAGLVRHAKLKNLKEMLGEFPSKRFDPALVKAPYVEDFGTAYVDAYEMEHFNMNKVDEFGNSLLTIAAQNGSLKIAKVLVDKGANPDHQNGSGESAAHYANAYGFMDFLSWVLAPAPDGGGANDTVENRDGLTPYDGLSG